MASNPLTVDTAVMMTRYLGATAAALAALALTGCSGGSPTTGSATTPTAQRSASIPVCRDAHYTVKRVAGVPAQTGEHGVVVRVRYAGHQRCRIKGYPNVTLVAKNGAPLPFRYRQGGGPYFTHRQPVALVLKPGDSFFIALAKYRCDLGIDKQAQSAVLHLPGARSALRIDLRRKSLNSIGYCSQPQSRIVYEAPIVAREANLFQ